MNEENMKVAAPADATYAVIKQMRDALTLNQHPLENYFTQPRIVMLRAAIAAADDWLSGKSTPPADVNAALLEKQSCKHHRIFRADCIAWCKDCGVITWASDANEHTPGSDAKAMKKWCAENVIAWGCSAESKGEKRCEHWCQQRYCSVTLSASDSAIAAAKAQKGGAV